MHRISDYSFLFFDIGISAFALLIVLLLTANPPLIYESFPWRKPLVGSVFILICAFGIFAALVPKRCSKVLHFERTNVSLATSGIQTSSHHPDCGKFSAHVIHINGHTFCAACTGLLFGGITGIVGAVIYFFVGWHIVLATFTVALIGVIAVVLGFSQLKFSGFIRLMLNLFFVLGAFLILVVIDDLIGSLFADFFIEASIVFWIFTRIQLSQWDHRRICSNCQSPCKVRNEEKIEVNNLMPAAHSKKGAYNYEYAKNHCRKWPDADFWRN